MKHMINELLDKYWQGETSLEEERSLRKYFASNDIDEEHLAFKPLFGYFESEAEQGKSFEPDLSFARSSTNRFRVLIPRIIAIAATVVLLFTVSRQWVNQSQATVYKNKYTELQDPEEALEITLDALGFVSHKLDKGTREISHIKKIEKTAVFKFDK